MIAKMPHRTQQINILSCHMIYLTYETIELVLLHYHNAQDFHKIAHYYSLLMKNTINPFISQYHS